MKSEARMRKVVVIHSARSSRIQPRPRDARIGREATAATPVGRMIACGAKRYAGAPSAGFRLGGEAAAARPVGGPVASLPNAKQERRRSIISLVQRDELRAMQAPLKERYTNEPEAAMVTLSASGTLGEHVSCSVQTGRAIAEAGLHPATGGDGSFLCSCDMLLEALVACAGVTLRAVAISLGISVTSGSVRAEGDLDFRGTSQVV